MIISSVALAGALGAGTLGALKYREEKRKKEFPWSVVAEKMAKKEKSNGPRSAPSSRSSLFSKESSKTRLSSALASTKMVFYNFKNDKLSLLFYDRRRQQLQDISSTGEEIELSDAEKEANRNVALAVSSLVLTAGGALLHPALTLLSMPCILYLSGWFFHRSYKYSKSGRLAIGLIDCILLPGTLLTGHFFAASLYFTFYYVSRQTLIKTEDHSTKSLVNVFGEQPRFVWIVKDGVEVEMAFDGVQRGDIVVVNAGETIAVDGTITDGRATIDQHMFTGESQPVEKGMGDEVFASTILLSGKIYVEVEKAGSETVAAQIGEILLHTSDFKDSIQSRGEQMVDKGAWPTLALSAVALPLLGPTAATSLLYSGFGYHMRIAAPITVLTFLQIASQNGILIKDGRALDLLGQVDTFVFDKTGTLTEEVPTVATIYTCHGYSQDNLLTYAAAAEYKQTHPIARAILREARERGLSLPNINEAKYEVGYGLKVSIQEQLIRVGSHRFMEIEGIRIPLEMQKREDDGHEQGHSLVYVAINSQLGGAIELQPTIRPEAKEIVSQLRKRQLSMYIISGDHEKPTKKLAQALGIENYFAETLPENKAQLIEQLQQEGKSVCFIGDGINDSIALKTANVSISLRGASSAATDSAQVIFMDGSLNKLILLLGLAKEMDINLKSSLVLTSIPALICIGGVFFFNFGLVSAIMLSNMGLAVSVSNALLPLLKYEKEKPSKPESGTNKTKK